MTQPDTRWIQRYNNFSKALAQLQDGVELAKQRPLSRLEEQGLIQAFEYTHEMAWKTLKDFLEERGLTALYGSRDVTREAFRAGLVEQGEVWMDMIKSRNLTSHTYNEEIAQEITTAIIQVYFAQLAALRARLEKLKQDPL